MKLLHLWCFVLLIDGILAMYFLCLSDASNFNVFWPEILGTFVGILGAISFEEVIRHFNDCQRGRKLRKDLLRELAVLLSVLRSVEESMALTLVWDVAKGTGDFSLIEDKDRGRFLAVHSGIELYNRAVDRFELAKVISGVHEETLCELENSVQVLKNSLIEELERLLPEMGGMEYLEIINEVE